MILIFCEQSSYTFSVHYLNNIVHIRSGYYDHIRVGVGCYPGGCDLGRHSAGSVLGACTFTHIHYMVVYTVHLWYKLCIRVIVWIISVQTVYIREKHTHKEYIGVDACAVNLMRPAMYGAYHHITVLGKENEPCDHKYDVTGSLCENNDKFAIDRMLPKIDMGDILVIHDTGAHGFAMGYNYNGKLKSAEVLLRPDGSFKLIRRAETPEDYFATIKDFWNVEL